MIKKIILTGILCIVAMFFLNSKTFAAEAGKLDAQITISGGSSSANLEDNAQTTMVKLAAGENITITAGENINGLYIVWDTVPGEWTLEIDGKVYTYGQNDFLHEYIEIPKQVTQVKMTLGNAANVCDISALPEGEIPSWVQDWSKPCEKADILLFSPHADDEQLFFGGILPYYAGELGADVQLVLFTQYWTGPYADSQRHHEFLNGIWHSGVKNYPVFGDFEDYYSETLETALSQYNEQDVLDFVTEQIRRFQAQVVISVDFNGEYGHGGHMILAKEIASAVDNSADKTFCPDSASKYGTWDVLKTYFHVYEQNPIVLNCRAPLKAFDGKTALDVAKESYLLHDSQQWCWFYVDDEYEYSIAKFGLYRTTVGEDIKKNDILENVTLYKDMKQPEAEETTDPNEHLQGKEDAKSLWWVYVAAGVVVVALIIIISSRTVLKKKRKR